MYHVFNTHKLKLLGVHVTKTDNHLRFSVHFRSTCVNWIFCDFLPSRLGPS